MPTCVITMINNNCFALKVAPNDYIIFELLDNIQLELGDDIICGSNVSLGIEYFKKVSKNKLFKVLVQIMNVNKNTLKQQLFFPSNAQTLTWTCPCCNSINQSYFIQIPKNGSITTSICQDCLNKLDLLWPH